MEQVLSLKTWSRYIAQVADTVLKINLTLLNLN